MLLGSLLLHLLLGLLILVNVRLKPLREPLPPPGIAMLFESGSHNGPAAPQPLHGHDAGSSPTAPLLQPATRPPAPPAAAAPPPEPVEVPQSLAPLPPTASTPSPSPPPIPETAVPAPLPPLTGQSQSPLRPSPERQTARALPRPPRSAPQHIPRSNNPFASPMELSFGKTPSRAQPNQPLSGLSLPSAREAEGSTTRVGNSELAIGEGDPGTDWRNALAAWIEAHKYYPQEAALNGEDGTAEVHVEVDRSGKVLSVELTGRSGSQWLDLGAQAMFRGARLPPFPQGAPEPRTSFDLTMHYILIRR